MRLTRRSLISLSLSLGAAASWAGRPRRSTVAWSEAPESYPQGVASGDPQPNAVLLWTRCEIADSAVPLLAELAEDPHFERVIARVWTVADAASDGTVRVLVGGLRSRREYWYRFSDVHGRGSRIGRTLTAPDPSDRRQFSFAYVSCQDVTQGAQNAYRKMIFEDERAVPSDQLGFVLHLGDFIYEIVWYPSDKPHGMYDRRVRDVFRYADGERIHDFNVPTTLSDYRKAYKAYLRDPDLQDARARFPFVCIWDNHEFSWKGWQSFQNYGGGDLPEQSRKVAANQAWFEYIPSLTEQAGPRLGPFVAPRVSNSPITHFDDDGLGVEPNNLAAIRSLKGYRALRFGSNVELFITDQHSYRSREPTARPEAKGLSNPNFPDMMPQEAMEILDAGRSYDGGRPPGIIHFGEVATPNFRAREGPQAILGAEQKAWLKSRIRASRAPWKLWAVTQATMEARADPQNLPSGLTEKWPGAGFAICFGGGDHSSAFVERAEIYDLVKKEGITGFCTIAGDRHSFWAGYAAKALPPAKFDPVGLSFVVGSISAVGLAEYYEYRLPKDHPLRPLYLRDVPGPDKPEPTINMLLKHGVRSCLEYAKSGDGTRARALSNPDNAPHVQFVDMGGHGYSIVRADEREISVEFVCIPRPVERIASNDGGPLRYRVRHSAALWKTGDRPMLVQQIIDGDPGLAT